MDNVQQTSATVCANGHESDVPSDPRLKVGKQRAAKRPASEEDARSTDSTRDANEPKKFKFSFKERFSDVEKALVRMEERRKLVVERVRNLLTLIREADDKVKERAKPVLLNYMKVSGEDRSTDEALTRLKRLWENVLTAMKPVETVKGLLNDTEEIVYGPHGDDETLLARIEELAERARELRDRKAIECCDEVAQ